MFESMVITLREGIEAALVIGIILTYLKRMGKESLNRSVYAGLALGVIGSAGAAIAFRTLGIEADNEYFEGTIMLVAGLMVLTMVIWMWRTGTGLKQELETKLASLSQGEAGKAQGFGLLVFTFVMVFREGVETVLFLAASSLSSGAASFIGGLLGLGFAVVFGWFFVKGTAKINLQRFFTVTGAVLLVLVVRLLLGSVHEFAERQLIPITPWAMKVIGYIVRDKASEIITMGLITLPLIMVLLDIKGGTKILEQADPVERRKLLAKRKKEQHWKWAVVTGALLVNLAFASSIYAESIKPVIDPQPEVLTAVNGEVKVPLTVFNDNLLHKFALQTDRGQVRFLAVRTGDGKLGVGLDACEICGQAGYSQNTEGERNLICKNCNAPIALNTIGIPGGCNPMELQAKTDSTDLVLQVSDLAPKAAIFKNK